MSSFWLLVVVWLAVSPRGHGALAGTVTTDWGVVTRCTGSNVTLLEAPPGVTPFHVYVFRGGETIATTSVKAQGLMKSVRNVRTRGLGSADDLPPSTVNSLMLASYCRTRTCLQLRAHLLLRLSAQDRLFVHGDGSVVLTNLTSDDLGKYRVEVKVTEDDSNPTIHDIRLVAAEPPRTYDGNLSVQQELRDGTFVRVKCGVFESLGYPPVSAKWRDPSGQFLASQGFADSFFYLDLPLTTSLSGTYCCQLHCPEPDHCCLQEASALRRCAEVDVTTNKSPDSGRDVTDSTQSRLRALEQCVSALTDRLQSLQDGQVREGACSQNWGSAMAQLVHLQVKDQLETHWTRLKEWEAGHADLRQRIEADLLELEARLNQTRADLEDTLRMKPEQGLKTCQDILVSTNKSGVYTLRPDGVNTYPVYCDLTTDGGGWLVFQRRQDGSVDFYRDWVDYEDGFGDLSSEFWLGLKKLHAITSSRPHRLRVNLMDHLGERSYAVFSKFRVESAGENYRLTVSGYSGTAGDSLKIHNGMPFSTRDRDNDKENSGSCAQMRKGAWWYNKCFKSNLNALYKPRGSTGWDGITWEHFRYDNSLTFTEMKIQPV